MDQLQNFGLSPASAYGENGFYFAGGGIELPVLWACAQVAQVFLGAGAFRVPLPGSLRLVPVFGTLL
jgi:hypothetical protein